MFFNSGGTMGSLQGNMPFIRLDLSQKAQPAHVYPQDGDAVLRCHASGTQHAAITPQSDE
jgi:hypothetical protein